MSVYPKRKGMKRRFFSAVPFSITNPAQKAKLRFAEREVVTEACNRSLDPKFLIEGAMTHQGAKLLGFALVSNGLNLLGDGLSVADVLLVEHVQVLVQGVGQRHARGDVELQNLVLGKVFELHD